MVVIQKRTSEYYSLSLLDNNYHHYSNPIPKGYLWNTSTMNDNIEYMWIFIKNNIRFILHNMYSICTRIVILQNTGSPRFTQFHTICDFWKINHLNIIYLKNHFRHYIMGLYAVQKLYSFDFWSVQFSVMWIAII